MEGLRRPSYSESWSASDEEEEEEEEEPPAGASDERPYQSTPPSVIPDIGDGDGDKVDNSCLDLADDDEDAASSLVQEIRESIQNGLLQMELQRRLIGESPFVRPSAGVKARDRPTVRANPLATPRRGRRRCRAVATPTRRSFDRTLTELKSSSHLPIFTQSIAVDLRSEIIYRSSVSSWSFFPLSQAYVYFVRTRSRMAYSTFSDAAAASSWRDLQQSYNPYGSYNSGSSSQDSAAATYSHFYPYHHLQSQHHLHQQQQQQNVTTTATTTAAMAAAAAAASNFQLHQHQQHFQQQQQQSQYQPLTPPPSNNDQCQDIKFDYGGVNSFYSDAGT